MQAKSVFQALVAAAALAASVQAGAAIGDIQVSAVTPTLVAAAEPVGAHVTSAISRAVGESSPELKATVQGDRVHLSGWARDNADLSKAIAAASRVDGVKRVVVGGVRLWSTRNEI